MTVVLRCLPTTAPPLPSSQVGQRHGGFTGMIQSACSLAQQHIWFERKVAEDRKMVANRLVYNIILYVCIYTCIILMYTTHIINMLVKYRG